MLGGKDGNSVLGFALGFMGALTVFVWLNGIAKLDYCAADENSGACFREWVGASSGWLAVAAAAVTVLLLNRQIRLTREMYDEDRRNRAATIANTVAIDLIQTSGAVRSVQDLEDLPALSITAGELFKDAVNVAPRLAAALRLHLREIEQLREKLRIMEEIPEDHRDEDMIEGRDDDIRKLAFRARVVALAFLKASQDLAQGNKPSAPFITDLQISAANREFGMGLDDDAILQLLR